ncbi:MAG: UbiA family prenyltransferase [Phycisphaerales bacterium]|nr:UbiA family prenyltransferase [Phycisphaerales bacterium]
MIKVSHSVFALPFALIGAFMAARSAYHAGIAAHPWPMTGQVLLIVGCMIAGRSVAMTFNRIVDAGLDARNPRTAGRAIPAGTISVRQATAFLAFAVFAFILCCLGFWWYFANPVPIALSWLVLAYLCFYSYTKRFTRWSHFVLGGALSLSPVGAWLAIDPASTGWPALALMGAVIGWVGGFDIIYACQDIDFDRAQGLFSLPSRIGASKALWIARLAHIVTIAHLLLLIPLAGLGWLYALGVGATSLLLLIENSLVRADDFSRVNVAFFTINGLVSLFLATSAIADIVWVSS